jgi:hypothetical protein
MDAPSNPASSESWLMTATSVASQACRPGARLDSTGSGCGVSNTALHFGQMIGSLLRSKNLVSQLLQLALGLRKRLSEQPAALTERGLAYSAHHATR